LIFEKKSVRTLEVNKVASLILNSGKTSGKSKKEKHTDFGVLYSRVVSPALFSNPFLEDLEDMGWCFKVRCFKLFNPKQTA
jgi:hypothetical protein